MDSKIGECWRCKAPGHIKCQVCDFALYCTKSCLRKDQFRHKVECSTSKRFHPCTYCKKVVAGAKRCSACRIVWYCGSECQKRNWKSHKPSCDSITNNIVEMSKLIPTLPGRVKKGTIPCYINTYYWGNTPAVDLLKLPQNEGQDGVHPEKISLLLAGVGDLRNIIKTGASLPDEFEGQVEFYLNDINYHILARNVLFLYLMFTADDITDIASTIVQLWYSICINQHHLQTLHTSLKELLDIDGDIISKRTNGMMTISEEHYDQLKIPWKRWLTSSRIGGPDNHIFKQRYQEICSDPESGVGWTNYVNSIPKIHQQSMQDWWQSGILLSSATADKHEAVFQNVTLLCSNPVYKQPLAIVKAYFSARGNLITDDVAKWFLKEPLIYTVPADIFPFIGWDYLDVWAHCPTPDISDMYNTYISNLIHTFLLNLRKGQISFRVLLCDCFQLTNEIKPDETNFDRISTSNISDYFGLAVVLDYFKPYLNTVNPYSVIITEFMNWRYAVKATFPFECNLSHELFYTADIFTEFLRADLLLYKVERSGHPPTKKDVPRFSEITQYNGLILRDFYHELNRVMPFQWQVNNRPVTQRNGHTRSLEWTLV
ncbi:uncharacterized protein LOC144452692 [Glandiceps talaboti]